MFLGVGSLDFLSDPSKMKGMCYLKTTNSKQPIVPITWQFCLRVTFLGWWVYVTRTQQAMANRDLQRWGIKCGPKSKSRGKLLLGGCFLCRCFFPTSSGLLHILYMYDIFAYIYRCVWHICMIHIYMYYISIDISYFSPSHFCVCVCLCFFSIRTSKIRHRRIGGLFVWLNRLLWWSRKRTPHRSYSSCRDENPEKLIWRTLENHHFLIGDTSSWNPKQPVFNGCLVKQPFPM